MTDISFTCPHCKQHFDAPPEMAGHQLACPTCQKPIQVPTTAPIKLSSKRGTLASRLVAGIVGGLVPAILAADSATALFGDPMASEPSKATIAVSVLIFLGMWAVSIVVAVKAERAAKAWRRLLIASACLSFAMPLAGFVLAGRAAHQFESNGGNLEAAVTAGAAGIATIFVGILGFFLGAIFLTVGLLVGRDRKEIRTPSD